MKVGDTCFLPSHLILVERQNLQPFVIINVDRHASREEVA